MLHALISGQYIRYNILCMSCLFIFKLDFLDNKLKRIFIQQDQEKMIPTVLNLRYYSLLGVFVGHGFFFPSVSALLRCL